jgi:hypothetical protein
LLIQAGPLFLEKAMATKRTPQQIVTNTFERQGAVDMDQIQMQNPEAKVDVAAALTNGGLAMGDTDIATDRIISPDQISMEAFMAQQLEIHLMEPASEDEPQFAEVTVNGEYKLLHRGMTTMVKRSHVAVLAQAKEQRLKQVKIVNPDGSMGYEEKMVTRMTYPFSVIFDPSGRRGADWMKQQMSNAK